MKKRLFALLLIVASVLMVFTSCDLLFGKVDDSGSFTVVVENSDGGFDVFKANLEEIENNKEGAKGVVEHLSKGDDGLYLEMVDSTYGAYVSAIGSIRESNADKVYVIVYTSVQTDSYDGAPTLQYEGVTLYQSGVGLSAMSVSEGGIILFRLEKSPY